MQLLFYKQDRVPGQKEQPSGYNLEITHHEGYQNQAGIEQFINEQQMINNKVLRSIIYFEEATRKTFFVALQQIDGDKLYMVSQFPEYIKELQVQINEDKVKTPGFDEFTAKEEILIKVSETINQQEQSFKTYVQSILVNNDLSDSLIVTVKR